MNSIQCSTVRITAQEISELDRKQEILKIDRSAAEQIFLKHGIIGERIIIQVICGLVLLSIGIFFGLSPILGMISKGDYPSTVVALRPFAHASPLILIGAYLIFAIFKRRYFLLVEADGKSRKVVFQDKISDQEIDKFIYTANNNYGYNILKSV